MRVNYVAIADDAQANGDATYQAAFTRMSAETVTEPKTEAFYSELSLMSELGVTLADTILNKVEAAVSPRLVRMIQSEKGVNLADAETLTLLESLKVAAVIDQSEQDALVALTSETKPKWPGLKPGHVQNAMQMRVGGLI